MTFLKFLSSHIIIMKVENHIPDPPSFTDKKSILASLDLIIDDIRNYDKVFLEEEKSTLDRANYTVNYKLREFVLIFFGKEVFTFYLGKNPYNLPEIDVSFAIYKLNEFRKII